MRVGSRGQEGQATVEFALFAVALVLSLMLIIQITWIGMQKWQFNHFANYAARIWSVEQDDSPGDSMFKVILAGLVSWNTIGKDHVVKFMWVSDGDATETVNNGYEDVQAQGIRYMGVAPLIPLFRPFVGFESFATLPIPSKILDLFPFQPPEVGLVRFEVFIPIAKEPKESPKAGGQYGQKFDNDCSDTPCTKGNKR